MDRSEDENRRTAKQTCFKSETEGSRASRSRRSVRKKRGGQAHRGDRLRSGWAEPRDGRRPGRVCPESEELSTRPCAQPAA